MRLENDLLNKEIIRLQEVNRDLSKEHIALKE